MAPSPMATRCCRTFAEMWLAVYDRAHGTDRGVLAHAAPGSRTDP